MNNTAETKLTKRISLGFNNTESNGYSGSSSISDDGRYIVFSSDATNLVPNDTNGSTDTFIYDRLSQTVELVDITLDDTQADASVSLGSISGNGRYITFASSATNLVANDTNGQRDIFVYDRQAKTTERISLASNGTQANGLNLFSAISDDGKYIAFESMATNLVANDTNGQRDIFVYDRQAKTTERISVASDGTQANSLSSLDSISDDGRYITFTSSANNLVANDTNGLDDIFVYDRHAKTTERISVNSDGVQGNNASSFSSIGGDGRYIAFESAANNLVANDTNGLDDIFVYDRHAKTTERISVARDGTQSNGYSQAASISDDGRYVAFLSEADNLVANDTNNRADIFVYDRQEQAIQRFDGDSLPLISGNSQHIVFNSSSGNLVSGDTNQAGDVFSIDLSVSSNNSDTDSGTDNSGTGNSGTDDSGTNNSGTNNSGTDDSGTDNSGTDDSGTSDLDLSRYITDDVHRFYQFEKGFHLYTTDDVEIDYVRAQSQAGELAYQDEGEKFKVLADNKDALTGETLEGVEAVYRFFNTDTGSHLYTTDEVEKAFIEENLPNYNSEGIKYHAFESQPQGIETIPVFRLLNTDTGSHLYTIDQNELNYIQDNLSNFSLENKGEATFYVFEL